MYLGKVMSDEEIPRIDPLTIVWINDNYNRYKHFIESTLQNCIKKRTAARQIGCSKMLSSKKDVDHREYFWIVSRHFDWVDDYMWEDDKNDYDGAYYDLKEVTWKEASQLCGMLDGHLPWFDSRESLSELLALLKLSQFPPTVQAIYIGLRSHKNEVSEGLRNCANPSFNHKLRM